MLEDQDRVWIGESRLEPVACVVEYRRRQHLDARDVGVPTLEAMGVLHETGEAMIAHCTEKGIPRFIPMGRIFLGGALAEQGDVTGSAELAHGIAGVRASGTQYSLPLFFAWLGELCGKGGRIEEGLSALEQGRAMSGETEVRFSLPEFDRIEGELLLARSTSNQAQANGIMPFRAISPGDASLRSTSSGRD